MKQSIAFFALVILTLPTFAVVDMKNANYSNPWIDYDLPGSGYSLKVERGYNSRSLFNGMFGFGWCSDFETKIEKMPENFLKLTECGSGQQVLFYPREFGKSDVDKTIKDVTAKMKSEGKLDAATIAKLAKEMFNDNTLRARYAQEYKISVPIKEGSKFLANGSEVETITYAKGVYTRVLQDGSSQRFNSAGLLTHLYDKNANYLKFEYDKGTIKEVVDNNGRRLTFKYYPNKKVKTISGVNNVNVEYKYSAQDDLIWVKNGWGNNFNYSYDDYHNLTKATYPDNTHIALTYDVKNDWVLSFQDREKCLESYKYEFDDKDPKMHYWSTVKKVCGKDIVNESKHEFWYKERRDGQIYLQKVASKVNSNMTEITYHETFGRPLTIRRNNIVNSFEYYPNGQVKLKVGEVVKLAYKYHTDSNKVSEVFATNMDNKGKQLSTRRTNFLYDKRGNLIDAKNTDGQTVKMTYDERGRIATITDQAKKIVKIQYEEKYGRPAIVTRPGLGSINVAYKPNGEIDKVTSSDGPSVALQVASSFNNLLEIIAPATAEIYN